MKKSLLSYSINNEDYTFYYREEVLFKSSKNNPFLYLGILKEGVKKLLPFNDFEIIKEEENKIQIKFFATACVVNLYLFCDEKCVYFKFEKIGKPDDRLFIRLYKKNTRTVGMGLNVKKDLDKIKLGVLDRVKEKKKDKEFINLDNTLNFYIVNGYYFANVNINDWEIEINNATILSSAQENIQFKLEYGKRFNFLPQNQYKLLKTDLSKINTDCDDGYDGYIVNINKDKNTPYIINKIRNTGKRIFIIVSPVIKEEELKNYNEKSLVKTDEGYLADIKDEQNIRTYANYLRSIFDLNPDGIYVEESKIKTINGNLKNILFYENLHNLINKIKKEYTEKYIIFNKLNTTEKVKQKETEEKNNNSLIFSYKNQINIEKEIYSIDYESIKKKENMYINSFLFSGYNAYFYECCKDEVEELTKQGKLQLIIKEENKSKNKRFLTKNRKNKH